MPVDAVVLQMPLSGRRNVALALTISVALHAIAYFTTPFFILAWREPVAARYDAMLLPMNESATEDFVQPKNDAPAPRRIARSAAPKPKPAPRSEANFVAPDNAIAVERSPQTVDDGSENGGEKGAGRQEGTSPVNRDGGEAQSGTSDANPVAVANAPAIAPPIAPPTEVAVAKPLSPPVELPAKIAIAYRMTSSVADGIADYSWTRKGQQFEIESNMQATGFIVGNLIGVLHQVSNGTITANGLRPDSYRIRRGDVIPDSADFLYGSNELRLTRGGDKVRTVPLTPHLQDMQSFLFQLAYDAPRIQRAEDPLEVMVTNARKIYRHHFKQVGTETLQTSSGRIETVHFRSEAADPTDTYEVWLAPGNHHLPVKLKFFAGRFPVELIATSIRTTP